MTTSGPLLSPSVELVFVNEWEDEGSTNVGADQTLHIKRDLLMTFAHFTPILQEANFGESKSHRIVIKEVDLVTARLVLQKESAMFNALTKENFLSVLEALEYFHSGVSAMMLRKLERKMVRRDWIDDPLFAIELIRSIGHTNPDLIQPFWDGDDPIAMRAVMVLVSYLCRHLACGHMQASAEQLANFLIVSTNTQELPDAIGVIFDRKDLACYSKQQVAYPFATSPAIPVVPTCECTDTLCTCSRSILPGMSVSATVCLSPPADPNHPNQPPFVAERLLHEATRFQLCLSATATEASLPSACACFNAWVKIGVDKEGDQQGQGRQEVAVLSKPTGWLRGPAAHGGHEYGVTFLGSNLPLHMCGNTLSIEQLAEAGVGEVPLKEVKVNVFFCSYPFRTMACRYLRQCIMETKWEEITQFAKSVTDYDRRLLVGILAGTPFRPFATLAAFCKAGIELDEYCSQHIATSMSAMLERPRRLFTQTGVCTDDDVGAFINTVVPLLSPHARQTLANLLAQQIDPSMIQHTITLSSQMAFLECGVTLAEALPPPVVYEVPQRFVGGSVSVGRPRWAATSHRSPGQQPAVLAQPVTTRPVPFSANQTLDTPAALQGLPLSPSQPEDDGGFPPWDDNKDPYW
ncbi:unnamed protein product [Vitrella brassicaformis CCMP3155]|uniref:Uncharacterized protein n=1 Tax=Vitrella brassicaformis (strain CCMP3155) TaxID=1169540 RepID=A0A0G4EPN9_VITBC|nr:unnamed protein product [Vitrella brassicaformis CCMP3155]|eukprot:CEL99432.1 unnamed protein product [Vitrella brassicaformis CCMP3155]